LVGLGVAALAGLVAVGAINWAMTRSAERRVVSVAGAAELAQEEAFDAVLVLGAGVYPNGQPTPMLTSRLDTGAELYHAGAAPVVLASGDNSRAEYNELAAMRRREVAAGVPAGDVYLDYAGFSTYESMYRARDVFGARRILVVTQSTTCLGLSTTPRRWAWTPTAWPPLPAGTASAAATSGRSWPAPRTGSGVWPNRGRPFSARLWS
jgi:vancomycin permeability regulator SanA